MRTIKIIAVMSAALSFSGCMKMMDAPNDGRVDDLLDVHVQYQRIQNRINEKFATASQIVYNGFGYNELMLAAYCDEAQESDMNSAAYKWYQGRVTADWTPVEGLVNWTNMFQGIRDCNASLMYLTDTENVKVDYDEDIRKAFVSQLYTLRAFYYLQVIKRWGGVPVMDKAYEKDHDYSADKRASFAQCVDFIIESCDAALAATDVTTSTERGFEWRLSQQNDRFTRGVAWAIKSQAALYAASPLWKDDYAGTEPYTWDRVAAITKEALDQCMAHGYALFDENTSFPVEGVNAYASYFLSPTSFGDAWDRETIYRAGNGVRGNVAYAAGLPITEGQLSAGACPTQEMVDAYEVVAADGNSSASILDLNSPYGGGAVPNINQAAEALGYDDDTDAIYENRDPRFYASIFYNGSTGDKGETIETHLNGNCAITLSGEDKLNTRTGYYLRKFTNTESDGNGSREGYFRVFRLAELYLNFAEAAFRSSYGADGSVPVSANIDGAGAVAMSARDAVNAVRARIGMPPITENGNAFWLRYCNERRVELAFEEHRFFDVRRWSSPDRTLESTDRVVSGMRISGEQGNYTYTRFTQQPRMSYENKYLLYPINLYEAIRMEQLTGEPWQNPGWE